MIEVPVEQDAGHDWRDESWKIVGSNAEWDTLYEKVEVVDQIDRGEAIELMRDIPKTCPNKLNEEKKSMGVVEPAKIHNAYLDPVENPEPVQVDMQGHELRSKRSYPHKLYIEYTCEDCIAKGNHDQHCIEWGIYRFWDKNSKDQHEQVIENLHLMDDEWKKYFFIGNQRNRPRSFIVISVIRWKKNQMYQRRMSNWT
jgi:hypothetical protein